MVQARQTPGGLSSYFREWAQYCGCRYGLRGIQGSSFKAQMPYHDTLILEMSLAFTEIRRGFYDR